MSQPGISILLRAGNNKQAAHGVLRQLVETNSYRPVEVVVLFNAPQDKHLQLTREFSGKLPLVVRPAKGRTFVNLTGQLRYDQVLILNTPMEFKTDALPKAAEQLRVSDKSHLAVDTPTQVLLVKRSEMDRLGERFLTAPPNKLRQVLEGKVAPAPGPKLADKQPQTPSHPQAQAPKDQSKKNAQAASAQPKAKPAAKQAASPDNAALDRQIAELEQELERLDKSLSDQYAEIERMDTQYEALQDKGDDKAQALKQQLKERVFQANETLKTLKRQHDDLERLRIRRYSIVA